MAIIATANTQAQTPVTDGYLTDGDIVSISVQVDENGLKRYYLEASTSGILTKEYATKDCLWQLGISQNNGAYSYTLKDLATQKYISISENPSNPVYSLANNATALSFTRLNSEDNKPGISEYGNLYYRFYFAAWNGWQTIYISQAGWWPFRFGVATGNIANIYIEKWNKEGDDAPGGGFYPETLIFPYANDNDEAQAQQVNDITFTIPETAVTSYQCINRPEEIIGGGQSDVYEGDITDFRLYWESSSDNTSRIIQANYYNPGDGYDLPADGTVMLTLNQGASAGSKRYTFSITPVGKSPMNLRTQANGRTQWVDYADRVVAEYKFRGNLVKQTMRVVRNAYHEEQLPPLVFHINPTVFTFGADRETVTLSVVPVHQHGSVVYDVNHNVHSTQYEDPAYPENLSLKAEGWTFTLDKGDANWLTTTYGDNTITITAEALNGNPRSAELTGTFSRSAGDGAHDHNESFTIPLYQRNDAGIQFVSKNQKVHTATRTIYYLPEDKIELRLAESNFFGYMRWYDQHTGKAPNYNFGNYNQVDAYDYHTTWYTTPRGGNNQAFTPINTPQSAATESTEGRSHGLYAINHHHGGILNEGSENSNNTPVLNGWNYTYNRNAASDAEKHASGYHTIACDVSAYTDYEIAKDANGIVTSITEPTLSYRQVFDLRPAGEIADKFAALKAGKYLEEYSYQAPAGKNILLTPQFKYRRGTDQYLSKLCYFYWAGANLVRVTDATWKEGNTTLTGDNGEYLTVSGTAGQTKTYTLTANNGAVRIAKFTVTFTDPQVTGPSRIVLKSKQEMTTQYHLLADIDFNYSDAGKKVTLADGNIYYNQALNWDESTYGYVYPAGNLAQESNASTHGYVRAASQGVFPFYGEYCLVNRVSKQWGDAAVSAEQHGGANNGFALYVDGTTEPGLVASIAADATICSGQTMYCSAWLCNPSNAAHQGSNPTFRCNVQGKKGEGEWEDAGVFFVGELAKESGWQQIVFPIESAHSYDSTRVSIYNFATSGAANDFLVDDISLFVSQLPIAAYQGKLACRTTGDSKTSAAAVLRLDYSNIEGSGERYMYYQIYNETLKQAVSLSGDAAYYHDYDVDHGDNDHDHPYGSVHLPTASFDPEKENLQIKDYNSKNPSTKKDTLLIYQSVSKLLDEMAASDLKNAKAYIKTTNSGATKWLMYVAHIIDNVSDAEVLVDNTLPLQLLYDKNKYTMRMAYSVNELEVAECNMQTPLHATQRTVFQLKNSDGEVIKNNGDKDENGILNAVSDGENDEFLCNLSSNCANDQYALTAVVVNNLAIEQGGSITEVTAAISADWLIGSEFDDPYTKARPATGSEEKKRVDEAFKAKYGYTRGQVASAIMYDMRRVPTDKEPNPNYAVTRFEDLQPNAFESRQNYDIVKHLYNNGWLLMNRKTVNFYLGSDEIARYWCFPIEGTAVATVEVDEQQTREVVIKDCNEPRWVTVASASSEYYLNMAPISNAQKTSEQKIQIPTIKVLEGSTSVDISLPALGVAGDRGVSTNLNGVEGNSATLSLENLANLDFIDPNTGIKLEDAKKPAVLEVGEEYTLRLPLTSQEGWTHIGNAAANCRIGYVLFNLQIVPRTLVWVPTATSFNGWGKNENWKGLIYDQEGNVTDTVEGFVPMAGSNVIIPKLDNTLQYPYIVPEHEHSHYPMTVGFEPHSCQYIYFAPGAHIHNQHLLQYERAYVDMQIQAGKWNMMSAPLQKMVSGDMYIPHTGKYNENGKLIAEPNAFHVSGFQGLRHRDAAYLFYQQFYNQTVYSYYEDGSTSSAASIGFEESNSLSQQLLPGSGYSLYGVGMTSGEPLTIRLPKPDTQYEYYTSTGEPSGQYASVDRGEGNAAYKFAFTANHSTDVMPITLTNNEATANFLFGNPTMAYIDMQLFLETNKAVLNPVFHRIEASTWIASTELTMTQDRYLAPMSSVMLETKGKTAQETISVKLTAEHLTLNNMVSTIAEEPSPMPRRVVAQSSNRSMDSEILTIYAFTPKATARTVLATNPVANDYYQVGEDALFVSSGIENKTSVKSPLNMYTVAEQVPMMADVRQGISRIPLSFLVDAKSRTETMQLAFYLSDNWTRECYLVDSITGQRIRIMDGLCITVPMPQNHEQRYFIEGPDDYNAGTDPGTGDDTGTAVEQVLTPNAAHKMWAYAPDRNNIIISASDVMKSVTLYDITGRALATLQPDLLSTQLTVQATVQSGVYIVAVTFRDNTTAQTQIIVQ